MNEIATTRLSEFYAGCNCQRKRMAVVFTPQFLAVYSRGEDLVSEVSGTNSIGRLHLMGELRTPTLSTIADLPPPPPSPRPTMASTVISLHVVLLCSADKYRCTGPSSELYCIYTTISYECNTAADIPLQYRGRVRIRE